MEEESNRTFALNYFSRTVKSRLNKNGHVQDFVSGIQFLFCHEIFFGFATVWLDLAIFWVFSWRLQSDSNLGCQSRRPPPRPYFLTITRYWQRFRLYPTPKRLMTAVWPDVGMKSNQIASKSSQRKLLHKIYLFENSPNIHKCLGFFSKIIFCQDLQKSPNLVTLLMSPHTKRGWRCVN